MIPTYVKCRAAQILLFTALIGLSSYNPISAASPTQQTSRTQQQPRTNPTTRLPVQQLPTSPPPIQTCKNAVKPPKTGCQQEFLGRCTCGNQTFEGRCRFVTNCTDSGFADTEVLSQLPVETEVLIFTGNLLTSLPPNTFGDEALYEKLEIIDLSNNQISEIRGQAFHRIPAVRRLSLNNNRWRPGVAYARLFANLPNLEELELNAALVDEWETSDDGNTAFATLMSYLNRTEMPKLTRVHLEGNRIGPVLRMEPFCEIPSIEYIFLANNSIQMLSWQEDCLHHRLRLLDLHANAVHYLTNSSMTKLDEIPDLRVDLTDNDFVCDCNMVDFYHWLHSTEVVVVNKENYVCKDAYPEENSGAKIFELTVDGLRCRPIILLPPPSFGVVHALLIIIIVVVVTLLLVVAYTNRRVISMNCRRVGEPLYRRMQYSTINKNANEHEMEV